MTTNEMYKKMAEVIDEKCFEFLNENGYKVEKPYTMEKALAIKEQLTKDKKKLVFANLPDKIEMVENGVKYNLKPRFFLKDLTEKELEELLK